MDASPQPSETGARPQQSGRGYSLAIPLLVACALFMQNLNSTVITTALPAIARSMGEEPLRLNLAITSYLLSLAIFIPISAWMADRFGGRNVFGAAIALFTVGSIACGLSVSLGTLVAARVVQGIGGAMMVPVGRGVMLNVVPKSEMVKVMTFLTMPGLLGPVVGPPLGGFFATYMTWRWIFFINVPLGVVGAVLVMLLIPNAREEKVARLDFLGFVVVGLGLAGLMFGFETLGRGMVPEAVTAGLLAGGALLVGLYVVHARRTEAPIIDLGLLRIPTFHAAIVGGFLFRVANGALPFLLPLMLQVAFGMSAFRSGLLTLATAAGALTMRVIAAPILRRFGFKNVLVATGAICTLFYLGYASFRPTTPHFVIFVVLLGGGFFRSLQLSAVNTLGYSDIPQRSLGRSSSFASMAQQLSMTVGVGLGALILHLALGARGGAALATGDFLIAFLILGVVSAASLLAYRPLARTAGKSVSGHRASTG